MASQIAIPVTVDPGEVSRKQTIGAAIQLCIELAGFDIDKTPQTQLGIDKGQFSRWKSGQEGIKWEKFESLMDHCGNDAPVLWMAHQRGYDLYAMRKRESELERENRLLREENAALMRVVKARS